MKFTIPRTELLTALQTCSRALSTNNIVPIAECFLFEYGQISATNMSVLITAKCALVCDPVAIPGKVLALVKSLPEQPLAFTIDGGICTITTVSGVYELPCEDGVDFPRMDIAGKESVTLHGAELSEAIGKILFASGGNYEDVQLLLGDDLKIVGCNGSVLSAAYAKGTGVAQINVASKSIATLPDFGATVTMSWNDKNVMFADTDTAVSIVRSTEAFPHWLPVIAQECDKVATVDTNELRGAVSRALLFTNNITNTLKLSFGERLEVTSENKDFGEKGAENLPVAYDSDQLVIGVNGNFLLQSLGKIDTETVTLSMQSPKHAILINHPTGVMVVMPFVV